MTHLLAAQCKLRALLDSGTQQCQLPPQLVQLAPCLLQTILGRLPLLLLRLEQSHRMSICWTKWMMHVLLLGTHLVVSKQLGTVEAAEDCLLSCIKLVALQEQHSRCA